MIPGLAGSPFTMSIVDLGPAAQRLGDLVARAGDDELGKPTPCPAYTLGDLIEHIGGLALAFRAAAEKDTASPYVNHTPSGDAARLGEGPRDRAALRRRTRARGRGGDLPGHVRQSGRSGRPGGGVRAVP